MASLYWQPLIFSSFTSQAGDIFQYFYVFRLIKLFSSPVCKEKRFWKDNSMVCFFLKAVMLRLEQTGIKCLLRHQDRIHRMTSEASEWREENKSAGQRSVCRKMKYLFPLHCVSCLSALRRNRPHLPAPFLNRTLSHVPALCPTPLSPAPSPLLLVSRVTHQWTPRHRQLDSHARRW